MYIVVFAETNVFQSVVRVAFAVKAVAPHFVLSDSIWLRSESSVHKDELLANALSSPLAAIA